VLFRYKITANTHRIFCVDLCFRFQLRRVTFDDDLYDSEQARFHEIINYRYYKN